MKSIHSDRPAHHSKSELLKEAKEAETNEDWKEATRLYQLVLKMDVHNEVAYDRLAIIFRKQKEWKKESQLLKKAIAEFEDLYASATLTKPTKKISALSNSFLKITGLSDRKGKQLYQPGPLAKWKKRKTILEKKVGKNQDARSK